MHTNCTIMLVEIEHAYRGYIHKNIRYKKWIRKPGLYKRKYILKSKKVK